MLEPDAAKVARPVLKGLGVGNDLRLLDHGGIKQARAWLRANNLKTGKSIQDAFINEIKGVLQEKH